jgi:hypothetical protein
VVEVARRPRAMSCDLPEALQQLRNRTLTGQQIKSVSIEYVSCLRMLTEWEREMRIHLHGSR